MHTLKTILALTICIFLTFAAEAKIIHSSSLSEAIHESNLLSGKDSLYLSDLDLSAISEDPQQYDITDQLVLINDMGDKAGLLKEKAIFKVAITGSLQLIGFDLSEMGSRLINLGKISLEDCVFTEGMNLGEHINNRGLFEIKNGEFRGSKDGIIFRDAYFKVGARVIL